MFRKSILLQQLALLATIAVTTLSFVGCDASTTDFQLNLAAGDKFTAKLTIHSKIDMKVPTEESSKAGSWTQELDLDQEIEVLESTVENLKLRIKLATVKNLNVRQLDDGKTRREWFDSTTASSTPFLRCKPFAAIVGKEIEFVISRKGRMRSVEGGEALRASMLESMVRPGSGADSNRELYKSQIGEQFSDAALMEMFGPGFALLPLAPVAVGDTWLVKEHVSKGFPMTRNKSLRLAERSDGQSLVAIDGKVVPNEKGASLTVGPSTVHLEMNGTQKGSALIDEGTGLAVKAEWLTSSEGQQISKTPKGETRSTLVLKTKTTFSTSSDKFTKPSTQPAGAK